MLSRRTALAAMAGCLATPHIARSAARRLRLGHNNTVESVVHAGAAAFAAMVAERTEGRLIVDIAPNGQIGNETQMLQSVAAGTLDISVAPVGTTATLVKEVGLVETLYLFRDVAHARAALDGPLGRHCSDLLAPQSVVVVAWSEIGIRQMTANKPVRSPADLVGLKVRVPISEVIAESFRAMGALADPLPFTQLQEALRTGQFDAQENPLNIIVSGNLNKYQSHLSLTSHVYTPGAIAVSGDLMEELSPADRAILLAAGQAGADASRAISDRSRTEALATLRAAGMTVVTDIDQSAMRNASAKARERLGVVYGNEMVQHFVTLAG